MENDISKWLASDGEAFLREVGIKKGDIVLDFGCGTGNYTIPAAKIVGEDGKVYALDKDERVLSRMHPKAEISGLKNIETVKTAGELEITLADESVDTVLLYDVLHSHSLPKPDDRRQLLNELHRILKSHGLLSVYPMHRDFDEVKEEIESANFHLENDYIRTILGFSGVFTSGQILNFKKRVGTIQYLKWSG